MTDRGARLTASTASPSPDRDAWAPHLSWLQLPGSAALAVAVHEDGLSLHRPWALGGQTQAAATAAPASATSEARHAAPAISSAFHSCSSTRASERPTRTVPPLQATVTDAILTPARGCHVTALGEPRLCRVQYPSGWHGLAAVERDIRGQHPAARVEDDSEWRKTGRRINSGRGVHQICRLRARVKT